MVRRDRGRPRSSTKAEPVHPEQHTDRSGRSMGSIQRESKLPPGLVPAPAALPALLAVPGVVGPRGGVGRLRD
eukprot:6981247-Lingulodinium_polyedra.AAC.1